MSAPPRRSFGSRLRLEELGARALPSVVLTAAGVLVIRGTPAPDTVTVALDLGNADRLNVYFNNPAAPAKTFDLTQVTVGRVVFRGGGGADAFTNATALPSTAYGGPGADTLTGGAGDDVLYGLAGDDELSGGVGADTGLGGGGKDRVSGNAGDDHLAGGPGVDTVAGGVGNDWLDGGLGDDVVRGGLDDDTCLGGPGRDAVDGGQGVNVRGGGEVGLTGTQYWSVLFDVNFGPGIGFGEVDVLGLNGETQTDVQLVLLDVPPGDTFAVTLDVTGDGSQVVSLGSITADADGTAILDLTDPPGLPAVLDGLSVLRATETAGDFPAVFEGVLADPNDRTLLANLWDPADPAGPLWGTANLNAGTGHLFVDLGGATPATTYTVYLDGDAATGVSAGQISTQENGYGSLEVTLGPDAAAVQDGTVITIADAAGTTVVAGPLEELSGQ